MSCFVSILLSLCLENVKYVHIQFNFNIANLHLRSKFAVTKELLH